MQEMNPTDDFPSLETERLLLRPLNNGDVEFVFRHFSDPDVNHYLLDEEPLATWEQAQAIVDFYTSPGSKSYNRWVIVEKTELRPVGTCGYHLWQKAHRRAEIGYDLERASWKKGIMTEALRAVLPYGFEYMGLNRISALVYPENEASIRLLERLGFQKEGLLRQYFRRGETYYDHWLLSLLREEWKLGSQRWSLL
jgi:ribosomal-protein-alanine N-acetyltransferase